MKRLTIAILVFSYTCPGVLAQDKKISVRKGFESLDDRNEPAMLSITLPKNGLPNSYLINAGISYDFSHNRHEKESDTSRIKRGKRTDINVFFNLNRNNMIEKEQNSYKLGLAWKIKLFEKKSDRPVKSKYFSWINTGEYLRNVADTTHSLYLTSYIALTQHGDGKVISFNTYKDMGCGFLYYLGWTVGPEYQYKFNTPKESEKGGVLRLYYSTEFRIRKKNGNDKNGKPLLELLLSNKGRYDIGNSTQAREYYLPLIKSELLYFPTGSGDFSLGFSYNSGTDPIAGLRDQNFYLLAMKFKI